MSQRILRRAVEETLSCEGISPRTVEVSIALVDDETIMQLNKQYRHKNRPTDVLSFSQEQEIAIPGTPKLLGDVVISVDTAKRQAINENRSLDGEICHLIIHGVLHLIGYDDVTQEGYEDMLQRGATIWQRVEFGSNNTD